MYTIFQWERIMHFEKPYRTYDPNKDMGLGFSLISQIVCFEGLNLEKQFTWNNK